MVTITISSTPLEKCAEPVLIPTAPAVTVIPSPSPTDRVAAPLDAPPFNPSPATTEVISPEPPPEPNPVNLN